MTAILIAKSKRESGWGRSKASATNESCISRLRAIPMRDGDLGSAIAAAS